MRALVLCAILAGAPLATGLQAVPSRRLRLAPGCRGQRLFAATTLPAEKASSSPLARIGTALTDGTTVSIGKVGINLFGLYYMALSLSFGIFWLLGLKVVQLLKRIIKKDDAAFWQAVSFWVNKTWGIITTRLGFAYPRITGVENLPPQGESYIIAPNHASWMDIPYIAMLPRRFKYVAKSDLMKVPILGLAMVMSGALFVDRSKSSQLSLFRGAMQYLNNGDALVIFPEGTRSKDGRLGRFRGGASKIASRCNVKVLPVSISNGHRIMPPSVIMPRRPGWGIAKVHVHSPIDPDGLTEEEIDEKVSAVIASGLPPDQQPLR